MNILMKPDNIPIAGMLLLTVIFGLLSFYLAFKNDRLRKNHSGAPKDKNVIEGMDVVYPEEDQGLPLHIHCWPYLVRLELLAALFVLILLIVWSIVIDAPLEEVANYAITPNPAKAPWYFLGLQDMLVYFDPWIAGVMLPTFIIIGLMAIPYVDTNPDKGNGYFTFSERSFPLLTFWFGYLILWVVLIIIGTFFRGPGWGWFWPWEQWDPNRVILETNINLNEFVANITNLTFLKSEIVGFYIGFIVILGYYASGLIVPYLFFRGKGIQIIKKMGWVRFVTVSFFFMTMMSLPIKMILRFSFNIKYIWVTPWFNI